MFGNKLGWILSGVVILFTTYIIVVAGRPPAISEPTGKLPQGLQAAAFSADPNAIVPNGTEPGNAADFYRQAAEHYRKNQKAYTAFVKAQGPAKAAAIKPIEEGIELLVKGRNCSKFDLFASKPTEVVNYDNAKPHLSELNELGKIAVNAGAIIAKSDKEKGKRYVEAAFVLGRHLYNERVVFEEFRVGTDIMSNAGGILGTMDEGKAAAIANLNQQIDAYNKAKLLPLWRAISGLEVNREGKLTYAGDMFQIARQSKEPMWRTEALLKLGRMQWMGEAKGADQRGAIRLLKQVADDPAAPASVKAAATAGRDLTVEKFRMFGGNV